MSITSTEPVRGYFGAGPTGAGGAAAAGSPPGTTGTTGSTSTTGTTSTTSTASADKDMFLKLLVAQMKYQDPMNPTDSSQFLAQSAQFTSLEKMQTVADQTTQLVGAQMAFGASSLVGRTVTYAGSDGTPVTGTVRGVAFEASGPVLDVGGVDVAMTSVLEVGDGSATTT